jgi:hypothetical protein
MPKLKKGSEKKSSTVAFRMPERQRHGLDIIARACGLSTTNAIAFAIRSLLQSRGITGPVSRAEKDVTLERIAEDTFDGDELMRVLKLANDYPQLLRPHEKEFIRQVLANPQFRDPDGFLIEKIGISIEQVRVEWDMLGST